MICLYFFDIMITLIKHNTSFKKYLLFNDHFDFTDNMCLTVINILYHVCLTPSYCIG